jgi:hypothetical protein
MIILWNSSSSQILRPRRNTEAMQVQTKKKSKSSNRKDRNPYLRLIPLPFPQLKRLVFHVMYRVDNRFLRSGSFSASASAPLAPPAAAGPEEETAGAPPPDPTFRRRALTSFPSSAYSRINDAICQTNQSAMQGNVRTFANKEAQMGSTSSTFAAASMACSFSVFAGSQYYALVTAPSPMYQQHRRAHTVISTPSSARIRAAYETASSALDILAPAKFK